MDSPSPGLPLTSLIALCFSALCALPDVLLCLGRSRDQSLFIISRLSSCSLLSHSYAHDVQSYSHCLASKVRLAILAISRATNLLNEWMSSNRLRLNPQKTQYMPTTWQVRSGVPLPGVPFPSILYFGQRLRGHLDPELTFADHITVLARSCFYQPVSCELSPAYSPPLLCWSML